MKKFLIIILCIILTILFMSVTAHADPIVNYNGILFNKSLCTICNTDGTVSGNVVIPNTIEGVEVKIIAEAAFMNCNKITSIRLPNTLTEISTNAFCKCTGLRNVYLDAGSTLEIIGENAFRECLWLETINIPDTISQIGKFAFCDCSSLRSVGFTMAARLGKIDNYVFRKCYKLETVNIPSRVTEIGFFAFENCSKLDNITIPSRVKKIGFGAFKDCYSLGWVTQSSSTQLESIESYAFDGCTSMDMKIPEGVKSIGNYTFRNCRNLAKSGIGPPSLKMPSTLQSILAGAFTGYQGDTIELPTTSVMGYNDTWKNHSGQVATTITDTGTSYSRSITAIDYNLNYNFNDSLNDYSGINPETYNIESEEIVLNNLPNRTNATFSGWYTQSDFDSSSIITSIPKGSTGDINLYAKWVYDIDIIAVDSNGILAPSGTVQVVHGNNLAIKAIPNVGYTTKYLLDSSIKHLGAVYNIWNNTLTIHVIKGIGATNDVLIC